MYRSIKLLDLPNCLILQLLSYLDATSLYLLGKTCTRLDEIIKAHKSLWRHVDARRAPNDRAKVVYCTERAHDATRTFLIRADNCLETLVDAEFYITAQSLKDLTVLAVENQTIDGKRHTVSSFPRGLHEFSLKKTVVVEPAEFFRNSSEHMQKLKVLILDECSWLASSAFMPISKYKNLEILSVYKCRNIENSIAYLSLSSYGFKNLKIFDARLSPLGNTLLRSIYRSQTLLAIYLQNEDITYKLDYFKRKLEILRGAPTRDFYVDDQEFDVKDTLWNEERGFSYEDPTTMDDRGLLDYLSAKSTKSEAKLPESVLYLDPYNVCTCEARKTKSPKPKRRKSPPRRSNGDESDDSDDQGGDRKITSKIRRLTELIRRSQVDSSRSRGISNHNHPRVSPTPQLINFGDLYRSLQNSGDRICVMNVSNLQRQFGNTARTSDDDSDEQNVERRRRGRRKLRKRCSNNNDPPCCSTGGPPSKKPKTNDEPEPGPSGLNLVESSDESDGVNVLERCPTPHPDVAINNLPIEQNADYRTWYFRDLPVVRIEYLNQIPKDTLVPLRRLSLRGYKKITDTALGYIKDLDLELLDLTYTNVTENAVHNYLVDHPSCRVVHEKFCVCPTNLHF